MLLRGQEGFLPCEIIVSDIFFDYWFYKKQYWVISQSKSLLLMLQQQKSRQIVIIIIITIMIAMIIIIIKVKVILKRMKCRGVFRTQSNIKMFNGFWLFTIFPKKFHCRCSKYAWVLNTPLKSKSNNKLFSSSRSLVSLTNGFQ